MTRIGQISNKGLLDSRYVLKTGDTMTGNLVLPAGSAVAPSLNFTGALTSGLFGAGTNQLGIAVNGLLALQMNTVQSWGWHGTAPSTTNVNTTTFTNTATQNPAVFNSTIFTYGYTGIGSSSFVRVLSFEAIMQRVTTAVQGASFTATQKISTPGDAVGVIANPNLDVGTSVSSGTMNMVGFEYTPSGAGVGKVTGGTWNFIGLRVPLIPGNYIGGGATVNFYSVYSSGTAILYNAGAMYLGDKITTYNAIATTGWGVPAIYGNGRSVAATAAVTSVATYTVGAADGSFDVSANVLVTTATLHNFTVTVAYTDEGNTARTVTLPFAVLAGTFITAITNAGGAVPYEGIPLHIRCKTATAITIATVGTFTTVTYNVEGKIVQTS